ncbi:peptidoglycan recognition protein family protein [Paracoccus sp. KR1-242]|uniref:peptidoglycan recognition protein family protein n=1 Tax=Paracoccus sp. KR1-242 TaxID=3410028 RepID=UPI003C06ED42
MDRIILHWTAGTNSVSDLDRKHYHFIIDGSGVVCEGDHSPEDNTGRLVDGSYAAHTLNCNTGSIGISLCGMARAVEAPFSAGPWPIKEAQLKALANLCAKLCKQNGIPLSRSTVLSHAEVQPTLKIAQRGKWDIAWLPGMDKPGDPVLVGDEIRDRIADAMGIVVPDGQLSPAPTIRPTIRRGDVGSPVTDMQRRLEAYGYDITPDSIFGRLTEAAVKQFQRSRGLTADGIVGPNTWSRLLA